MIDEIKAFFALIIVMGLVHQQDVHNYWSLDLVTSTPFFGTVMPKDRFLLILKFLHFCDNEGYVPRGQEGYDPLYKLGLPYHTIIELFGKNYYPTKMKDWYHGLETSTSGFIIQINLISLG